MKSTRDRRERKTQPKRRVRGSHPCAAYLPSLPRMPDGSRPTIKRTRPLLPSNIVEADLEAFAQEEGFKSLDQLRCAHACRLPLAERVWAMVHDASKASISLREARRRATAAEEAECGKCGNRVRIGSNHECIGTDHAERRSSARQPVSLDHSSPTGFRHSSGAFGEKDDEPDE